MFEICSEIKFSTMVFVREHLQVLITVSKFPFGYSPLISNHLSVSGMLIDNSIHARDHSKINFLSLKRSSPNKEKNLLTKLNWFVDQPSGMICFRTSPSGGLMSMNKGSFTLRKKIDSRDNFRVSSCLRRA